MRFWAFPILLILAVSDARADPAERYLEAAERVTAQMAEAHDQVLERCTAETAEAVQFVQLTIDSVSYIDRCVRISGIAYGREIFLFPEQLYLSERFDGQALEYTEPNPFRIGMQSREPEIRIDDHFYDVEVIGIAADCSASSGRMGRAAWIAAVMRGGFVMSSDHSFCGWQGHGAVIEPVSIEYGDIIRSPRLTGPEARERYGSIWQMAPESPAFPVAEAFAERFLELIRRSDAAALQDFLDFGSEGEEALFLSDDDTSPFFALSRGTGDPQRAVFWQIPVIGQGETLPDPIYSGEERSEAIAVCFCREPDCSERWPIAFIDAVPKTDLPFACVVTSIVWDAEGDVRTEQVLGQGFPFRDASPFYEPSRDAPH